MRWRGWRLGAVFCALILVASHRPAFPSGGAYQVDTSEVSSPGNCKIEAWVSGADNRDFYSAISPSCTMFFLRPIELGAQFSRARMDGEWATSVAPKLKINFIPGQLGKFGLALTAIPTIDLGTGQMTGIALNLPSTFRIAENTRFNVNAGWAYDRLEAVHYFTYGFGIDVRTPDNVWTLTAELYGQVSPTVHDISTYPRFQVGIRYRPIDRFSIDLIYGRNIMGENANWLTLATILRFPADK